MTNGHNRRRFLQLTGTGAVASLAGCTDLGLLSDDEADERLTAIVEPDQAAVEALYDDLESGEIDEMEFQQRAQELQEETIAEFEAYADDEDIQIDESTTEGAGLYLIDGPDEAILSALRSGPVTVLYGSDAYDLILEQQAQQQQQQEQPELDEDDLEEQLEDELEDDGSTEEDTDDESDAEDDE
ncbi:hypothetical protein [Natronorubrum sulfidifaciens]|uniref:Uncharacterized protein n=1 Tax=Natronorubrum sulfidifaciens JCM 14089 TaxID=1230460 RepID=L9WFB5_9EURY|nr:hypothetical protein [Natronorubrum sulfidifaciens]ELY48154.1 hypothetical protein C495_01730 [Natronorubrum sulfidifaciens JCM 14089]